VSQGQKAALQVDIKAEYNRSTEHLHLKQVLVDKIQLSCPKYTTLNGFFMAQAKLYFLMSALIFLNEKLTWRQSRPRMFS